MTNEICAAMEEAGIAPALAYAFRKTSLLLTTECIVVEKKEDKHAQAGPHGGGMGGMY